MPTATERYGKNRADAREKVVAFLCDLAKVDNLGRTTSMASIRAMLNLGGHRAFAEVVLAELEKEGHIEQRGKLIYLIGNWGERASEAPATS